MKHFYLLISFVLFSSNNFAQKYEPDRIIFKNDEYDYRFHHLEQYFNYYPEKRIVPNKDSTIINRGYIAVYEIYENELFLRDIRVIDTKSEENKYVSVREKFSPSKEERIPLRWVNGVIIIGLGEDDFKNDSLRPINSDNLILEIRRGKVQRELKFGKEQMRVFKNFQWGKYQKTYEYQVLSNKLRQNGLFENEIIQHIFNNVFYYSRKIYLQK